jgi:hypothetical protein
MPTRKSQDREKAKRIAHNHIELRTFILPHYCQNVTDFLQQHSAAYLKRQLNNALPLRFWEYDDKKKDYDLNIITLRNFLNNFGYYTFSNVVDGGDYMYIKVEGKIVNRIEREKFSRHIETFVDHYLSKRGENIKLRNKITISNRFTEKNLSGLKELDLDFGNSGKGFQNWFFADKSMWTVTKAGIKKHSQNKCQKFIWDNELLDYPSEILEAPFQIFFKQGYEKKLKELHSYADNSAEKQAVIKELAKLRHTDKYDIEILDRKSYFLQFLWATSYAYFERAESKGFFLKPEDFWYNFPTHKDSEGSDIPLFSDDEISEMKLHMINKITWIGYYMKDFREPHEDYGLAILDAVDEVPGMHNKGAAGGGKSLITKGISKAKTTCIIKAEREDFAEYPFRYSPYKNERVIVCDDMHKASKIGNMLTDFSEGLVINRKHKQEIPVPFKKAPKIIVTRNYIDDEGERVDRRLGRMFVFPFFHDNKSGRYKTRRKPADWFGRQLFDDDTEEDKSKLINFFAYAYIANMNFGEVNPPMQNMEAFRTVKRIGEPLIEFLDEYFEDPLNLGFIEKVPLYESFIEAQRFNMSPYQRSNVYNTAQKFKNLLGEYCKIRTYVFNPDELINETSHNRIMRTSETKKNKAGYPRTVEFIYVNTQVSFLKELKQMQARQEEPAKQEPVQMQLQELPQRVNDDELPF